MIQSLRGAIVMLFLSSLSLGAEPPASVRFFEKIDPVEKHTVVLYFDGDQVHGQQVWQPTGKDGARGFVEGVIEDDRIRVVYHYTIEGSEQSEQQIFRLTSDSLLIGHGELVDPNFDGNLLLKDPDNVVFDTELEEVAVVEPKPGSAERKAMMEAMRQPISKQIGKRVIFTGDLLRHQDWARFQGSAAPEDGQMPTDPDALFALDLDLFVLLKKDGDGEWQVKYSGFSGDIGAMEEAREKFPEAPWVLF